MTELINLLKSRDPANRELGFILALSQGGVELLNKCIAANRDYLNLSCTGVTELPEGIIVRERLDLSGCTALHSLPQALSIGDWLDLSGCRSLHSLPQGLSVGGSLYLRYCAALPRELPICARIGGAIRWE